MNFSAALEYLKDGNVVTRLAWPTKTRLLMLNKGSYDFNNMLGPERTLAMESAFFDQSDPDDKVTIMPKFNLIETDKIAPWFPTHEDILANDWGVIDKKDIIT